MRSEIAEVAGRFADKRRTKIGGAGGEETEFVAEDFIVDEEVTVILSRDGWLKRVREVKDLSATRLREGDAILAVIRGSTKEPMAIFSNFGSAYILRINDVPASTGYGEPVQKLFNFRDGERVVGALSVSEKDTPKGTLAVAVSKNGFGLRFGFDAHRELSTRAGRRFAKPADGDEIVGVTLAGEQGRRLRRDQRRAGASLQGWRDPRAGQPWTRRHHHQGGRRRRWSASASAPRRTRT